MTSGHNTFFEWLDRLGLLKYVLATVLTGLSFSLTAGAYMYEEISRRPPKLPPGFSLAQTGAASPSPGFAVRAPVVTTRHFAVVPPASRQLSRSKP